MKYDKKKKKENKVKYILNYNYINLIIIKKSNF